MLEHGTRKLLGGNALKFWFYLSAGLLGIMTLVLLAATFLTFTAPDRSGRIGDMIALIGTAWTGSALLSLCTGVAATVGWFRRTR